MRKFWSVVAALVAINVGLFVGKAAADNYGGVSRAYRAKMQQLIHRAFDRYGVGSTMVCIANRESGFNPRAANWRDSNGGSFGLFQINGIHKRRYEAVNHFYLRMSDPVANIAFAVNLYRSSGLGPWGGGC